MNNLHAIEQTKPMDILRCLRQPPEVWRDVEQEITRHWFGKAKRAALGEAADDPSARFPYDGWLRVEIFEVLLAVDVPVTRLFTLMALRHRARAERSEE